MIEYIQGAISSLEPTRAVIDCNGVGYGLEISLTSYDSLQRTITGSEQRPHVKLLVHEVIREDEHLLYGFCDEAERAMFRLLIGVNGVGAATARVMLSSMSVDELRDAVATQDVKLIQRVKGIGAKTAQRIALELQDKVGAVSAAAAGTGGRVYDEALTALTTLGFPRAAAGKALQGLAPGLSVEEMIKEALKSL
ncbi:MAG: Holliday junction DNA helicase subunit RuvA [bacterium P3]|nr:MAG: Holliday junction DNA helicase subunit RuvA [bacterium P3]KWW40435.1 MAG: Holliday junction DNA helicase subunit RuvA [bacterium F083]